MAALELEWFGQTPQRWPRLNCAASMMKSVWMWGKPFAARRVRLESHGETLKIEIPPAGLVGIRVSSAGGTAARAAAGGADLDGIALVRQESGQLACWGCAAPPRKRAELQGLGSRRGQSDRD